MVNISMNTALEDIKNLKQKVSNPLFTKSS